MPVYYAVGDALVTGEELIEKRVTGDLNDFLDGVARADPHAEITFSTGRATPASLTVELAAAEEGEVAGFEPIGLGKPLTIEIRHLYTGRHPRKTFFDKSKDMLFTSAMKGLADSAAAARAVNQVREGVTANTPIATVAATEQGTPLVYYTPALTEPGQIVTFEMIFDEFPKELFEMTGSAFKQAAGIPIFASASAYMLAAGMVVNLAGRIGENLFDGHVAFRATDLLAFDRPGAEIPQADFRLVVMDDFDRSILQKYSLKGGRLVDGSGMEYRGDHPYVVISLDGRKVDAYENFSPTAASAALLDRFFHIGEGKEQPLDPLIDALKLYNDLKFYERAKEAKARRDAITDTSSAAYKKAEAEYQALLANVLTDEFKPLD